MKSRSLQNPLWCVKHLSASSLVYMFLIKGIFLQISKAEPNIHLLTLRPQSRSYFLWVCKE